ncbi:similar to Saccharomyces cerevisiae YIL150C MCM10 Essential chromatin-associated protein involved in the initiation of DNA replication [Maudiozyma barnettii]|uniref:Similar to Saccharomyces cerevisiae YIL150C MCM10 Essential chromatin-associated protein involved in the initiation of DNA replication n=1 Tax=Maudiozyma barnettii TaxID=61262 RepID=A0A8H2ZJR9_9SACH|nr:Mcm10p [Kazachstania barnettii]CAB4256248.1 similar to Saccharomyces cerevisiae YIL150C MCM10 Essential chromatin-associated protein involved in the initiation of DNA replication [Kazachstania barnettii]CAD1784857.1 similar to Saccharomyces cerevisiae YIL150C MCM10 Essential chromatin-associated protein involved in the initiation of DNA replication [Kazachstania barnettii]
MDDPRELKEVDHYDNNSSDSDEEHEIQRQLDEMAAQKADLENRLRAKKERSKILDPNFRGAQVPSSPEKKKPVIKTHYQVNPRTYLKEESQTSQTSLNINEVGLSEKLHRKYSTDSDVTGIINNPSYFSKKFQESKQQGKDAIHQYQTMMSTRVHAFDNISEGKSYPTMITDEMDEFSHLWVKKRYIPSSDLKQMLQDIKVLRLSKLFAKVRPPKFQEPQYSNWATIGIISKKDEIKFTSSAKPQKYFKFVITDFRHTLDVYIFGKQGAEKYYNLRVGDIIAILNPEILPWRPSGKEQFIKSFNLRISHGYNCILEIGQSKDIGWCPEIIKTKNVSCGTPINISTDRCCEYHREIQFRKTNSKRVDLTGNYALGAPMKAENQPMLYKSKAGSVTSKPTSNQYRVLPSWSQQNPQFYDKYGGNSRHFSSSSAAKAFFDEKYQNPDMLTNLDNKKRKLMDKKKNSRIDKQLNKILKKGTHDVEGLANEKKARKMKANTQHVLESGLIQRLGFDPTRGQMATVLNHHTNDMKSKNAEPKEQSQSLQKKNSDINDLISFKKEKVFLKPSRVALMNKINHRESVFKATFKENESPARKNNDSDSDLDII